VPFVALDRQHAELTDELRAAFERVLGASAYILGHEVEQFEAEFAAWCGAEHCVGVASGTAALTLALQAAGVGPGDEVVVPAHTFIASALAVVHAGATPVFCEVDDETGLIDVDAAAAAVTERTAALLPVHLYGQACDMDAVRALAERHGLMVLEDAAQAHGATWNGTRTGSLGDAAAFSFYPSKNLGALGDAGAICTNDAGLAERARALRHLGQLRKGEHLLTGWNERLDGLQAAFLRVKLPRVEGWNAARRQHAQALRGLLDGHVRLLGERAESPCIYHLFPIRIGDRDAFARQLADVGIATGVHYAPSVPDQPPFREYASGACPVAAAWAAEELSLPMFEHLTSAELKRTAAACVAAATASAPAA
jgi:dTDP-4-amino-4,6-dideoxygalactose transaminase